jgi:hypothetical protein
MSIEEIADGMGKGPHQLFTELMGETESQVTQLNLLAPEQNTIFHRGPDRFNLERGGVKLLLSRGGGPILLWARIEVAGPNMFPKTDKGEIEMGRNAYWIGSMRFQDTREAALFVVNLVSGV